MLSRVFHVAVVILTIGFCQSVAKAAEFGLRHYRLRVPDGFEVRLAAEPPLVTYPICGDFDDRGRLYICESSGTEEWNRPQPKETRHRVTRLEDTDGDGLFDRRTVFAEFEMLAQGSAWLDGSLYVAAAPVIWKLTDADDDGVAEQRDEWVKTDAVTGCLNDLRGPYRGPDGYIYWCKGPATHTYLRNGQPWTTSARHLLRRHPRGSDVDVLMVGGMDNSVEVAFSPSGERFVTCTNFQMLGAPRNDGLLHAIYGAVYPKDIAPVYEFPWTGPDLMPILAGWGAMSPAGLMCYESTAFGGEYRGNLFSALFSGQKVLRHVLEPVGGTFATRDEAFLTCDNVEFHPTDVLEDADGSLLVIETGGWYRHCCPSSTFYRPDVRGAIYRISKTGARSLDPLGTAIGFDALAPDELTKLLGDERPLVRRQAADRLARLGNDAIPALQIAVESAPSAEARQRAVWAATRIGPSSALGVLRTALGDKNDLVRHAALNAVSLRRDPAAAPQLLQILECGSMTDRRIAAEALGRVGHRAAVPQLLAGWGKPTDRFTDHALIYALIEIADVEATRQGLDSKNNAVRRGAMIALDQMSGGGLSPQSVLAELQSTDAALQTTAWWLVSRHSHDWGNLLADRLTAEWAVSTTGNDQRVVLKQRLAQLARAPGISSWIVGQLTAAGVDAEMRMFLLEAMGDAGGQFADPLWVEALLRLLRESDRYEWTNQLVATLRKLPPVSTRDERGRALREALHADLLRLAQNSALSDATRVQALATIRAPALGAMDDAMFQFLLRNLAPDQPLNLRSSAAEALVRCELSDSQREHLAGSLKNVAAPELTHLLTIFRGNSDANTGRRLISSLSASSAAADLNAFRLQSILANYDVSVRDQASTLLARLEQSQANQLIKAKKILQLVDQADARRGIQVFLSQRAACTACHKAAHVGGVTGPHLQGIGKRRSVRDLVESILFPSASLVQSFETWIVTTDDGRTFSGVLLEDKPDEIRLSAGPDKVFRSPRGAIEAMTRSSQSIMPTGLDKVLSDQELADLVAYLKSL